jgi:hypothetical protein
MAEEALLKTAEAQFEKLKIQLEEVRYFHGEVEEAAIRPRALTDTEVAAFGR